MAFLAWRFIAKGGVMRILGIVAALLLAATGQAQAQFVDTRGIMGGGLNFFGGGASTILRLTVYYPTRGAVAKLVEIGSGVVSGVFNPNDSALARRWRPRHHGNP